MATVRGTGISAPHRLSADRQADPRTLVLASTVKPLEGLEELLPVFRLDANSVVGDPKNPTRTVLLRCHAYGERSARVRNALAVCTVSYDVVPPFS